MLTTQPPEPLYTEQREFVERAESVIRGVRELEGAPVFCRFDNGTLSLHGRVNSFHAKQLAQTAAAEIAGIGRIANELRVIPRR